MKKAQKKEPVFFFQTQPVGYILGFEQILVFITTKFVSFIYSESLFARLLIYLFSLLFAGETL